MNECRQIHSTRATRQSFRQREHGRAGMSKHRAESMARSDCAKRQTKVNLLRGECTATVTLVLFQKYPVILLSVQTEKRAHDIFSYVHTEEKVTLPKITTETKPAQTPRVYVVSWHSSVYFAGGGAASATIPPLRRSSRLESACRS